MTKIIDALIEFNPWWKAPQEIEFKEREVYGKIQKFMPLPQIIGLTGLRRVGKTTILLKIAEDAAKKGLKHCRLLPKDLSNRSTSSP